MNFNMKTRHGFVSNSSAASFVVQKSSITEEQVKALLDYTYSEDNVDGWNITDDGNYVRGDTSMDNDALDEFLESIDINQRALEWWSDS